jgi:sugar lactone lactonase YvrE
MLDRETVMPASNAARFTCAAAARFTRFCLLASVLVAAPFASYASSSYYPVRLDDSKAVYLERNGHTLIGDGVADDTEAIQKAIDQVQEKDGEGIVFLPSGRYRITRTLFVWPSVRVIGFGPTRPVLFLGDKTPGFQDGMGYMVFFAGGRPGHERPWPGAQRPIAPGASAQPPRRRPSVSIAGTVPADVPVIDANPGTFYSTMSNVDFEVGAGNPAAVGIRFHVAQHCYLTHMDFHMGSGLAALHDVGNEAEDLHFYGGQYGIMTRKPSPGWQFTLLDSTFEGQTVAAIKEHEAGLTMIHDRFLNVPEVVAIDPGYAEELWIKDSLFEHVSGPALTISNENNARTEINAEGIQCKDVKLFALFRDSKKKIDAPAGSYRVESLSHGLTMPSTGAGAEIKTSFHTLPLSGASAESAPAIRDLPARDSWVNLLTLGVKGDGVTDDTAAIQKAIDEHTTIYVPMGRYLVSDTIRLKSDTVLIGLHPSRTQFDLADQSASFQGPGSPKALLETPSGGANIVTGIGLYTGGMNSRAVGALWRSGKSSLLDDVRFLGGHGTNNADGSRSNPYNNTHTADPDLAHRWDGQYPSLWITNGGGGTFANIWTPDTFAQAGIYVSNTDTEGHVYELSSEHHVRNEMKLNHVANWEIFALQTEEERGEGPFALPLEIDNSKNILVANYHSYRVVSTYQPFPYAVRIANSENIRFRNLHVYCDAKASFDNSVFDQSRGLEIRPREIAALDISDHDAIILTQETAGVVAPGAKVEKLAGGFFNASGAAVDGDGRLYFVDAHWQRIYRWSPETHQAEVVRDNPLDPVNLAFDRSGNLMVTSYSGDGTVYSFRPDAPENELTLLKPTPASAHPGATVVLPIDYWRNENDFAQAIPVAKPYQYVSPDGSTILPAGQDFVKGELYYGTKMADVLRAYGLAKSAPGKPFYVTDESGQKTYSARVGADGTLTDLKLFAEQGGESVNADAAGNVYIADGQIDVFSPQGKKIATIDVPERPTDLVFGGKDGRTLFILARTSLYALRIAAPPAGRP